MKNLRNTKDKFSIKVPVQPVQDQSPQPKSKKLTSDELKKISGGGGVRT